MKRGLIAERATTKVGNNSGRERLNAYVRVTFRCPVPVTELPRKSSLGYSRGTAFGGLSTADKDGGKIGKLRGKRFALCFAHCFLVIKVLLGMNPPVQLTNLSLLCYALACVEGQHSSKHWTPKQQNKTAELKADKCPTSHFTPFNC